MDSEETIERLTAQRNELLVALKVFDALIEHQYCGTREAMSALQHAAFVAKDAIAKAEGKTTMYFEPRGSWEE